MIIDDLEKLEKEFAGEDENSLEEIRQWRREATEKLAVISLKENKGLKMLLDGLQNKVEGIDSQLKDNIDIIGTEKSKYLYHEKLCYQYVLSFFNQAENILEDLNKKINDNL